MQTYRPTSKSFLHLPVHSGIRLHITDPRLGQLSWHLAEPLFVVECDESYTLVTCDWDMKLKLDDGQYTIVSQKIHEHAPASTLKGALQHYLKTCKPPVKSHQRFKRMVTLDMWLSEGHIAHTYDEAAQLILALEHASLAKDCLLYLPGWHAPYDLGYPAYAPADELGGQEAFSNLFTTAESVGCTIMLHLNIWGYDPTLNLLPDYQEYQLRDEKGAPLGWPGVTRTGSTNPIAYMRVDDPRWQKVYLQHLEELMNNDTINALFMDQMGAYHGTDPAFDAGVIALLDAINRLNPNLLIGGEIIQRHLVDRVGISQAWGQPWCGLSLNLTDAVSPIVGLLFNDVVQLVGHLGLPSFVPCRYTWTNYPFIVEHGIEQAASIAQHHNMAIGALPHVRLNFREYGIDPLSLIVLQNGNDQRHSNPAVLPDGS